MISDYDKGVVSEDLANRVLGACQRLKVPTFVRPKTSQLLVYRGATAMVCNRKEAALFVQRPLDRDGAVEEAGKLLLAKYGCAGIVVTLGENGMSVFEDGKSAGFYIPATSFEVTYARVGKPGVEHGTTGRQVFDVTGAGDTVIAVLAVAVAAGATLREAAVIANRAAGVVVGKLGTATVSPAELLAALREPA